MRGYINGTHSVGAASIASDTWPASTAVLAVNNIIRFESHSTEYTITALYADPTPGTSSSTGTLGNFTISPVLSEAVADNVSIIAPSPRTITSSLKTELAAETGVICYFMEFDFEIVKHISAFADAGGGTVDATATEHGFDDYDSIILTQTDDYDGTYTISNVTTNTFRFTHSWEGTETGVAKKATPTYIATTTHDISWDSKTWQGVGGLLQFEEVSETSDMQANGIDIILSGVDQVITALILNRAYRGRFSKVWLVHINTSGTIVSDPLLIFWGRMNGGFEIEETRDESLPGTVNVRGKMEDRLASTSKVTGIMTNMESHQHFYSTDKFFSFVPKLVGKRIVWGKVSAGVGSKGGFCFISTAVMESKYKNKIKNFADDCLELQILRNFRDTYLTLLPEGQELINEYYEIAPLIITKINKLETKDYVYNIIYDDLITPVIKFISNKEYEKALDLYKNFVYCLKLTYLND